MKLQHLKLWFDVESKYEATLVPVITNSVLLWFDVESKYEATLQFLKYKILMLWFDVESKYEATGFLGTYPSW